MEKENIDLIIKEKNIIYQLTSSYNQVYNNYNNLSNIDLAEYETKLRKNYNISNSTKLLIFKVDKLYIW